MRSALVAAVLTASGALSSSAVVADEVSPGQRAVASTGVTRRERLEVTASAPRPSKLPFADADDKAVAAPGGAAIPDKDLADAKKKIRALKPYLDEIERYIFTKDYEPLRAFLTVFSEQEASFVNFIDAVALQKRGGVSTGDADAMEHEAKEIFLALDSIRTAATLKKPVALKKGYLKLALAYDRFLKAGDLLPQYDKVVSTEPFFATIPDEWLVYDAEREPVVQQRVLFIAGPDKGRTGVLLGYTSKAAPAAPAAEGADSGPLGFLKGKEKKSAAAKKAVVKLDNYMVEMSPEKAFNEVKEVPYRWVAAQREN